MPAPSRAAAPPGGWPQRAAPHGRLLGPDLGAIVDDQLLPASGRATLYAVGRDARDYDARRDPLVLIHGIAGRAADLTAVADRFAASGHQIHVLVYRDLYRLTRDNGDDLAEELKLVGDLGGPGRTLRVVAHSLGGLVMRRALGRLAGGVGIERFARVRVVGVDNPWQGFGMGNDGLDSVFHAVMREPFPGLADMYWGSPMFVGDAASKDPVQRAGLFGIHLPDSVELELVFAAGGGPATNWTRPEMAGLVDGIAAYYRRETPVRGTQAQVNFWRAILDSTAYPAFQRQLRAAADAGPIDASTVRAAFDRWYPRFAGDHTGCLREQAPDALSLPEHLVATFR